MIPLAMIVLDELRDCLPDVPLTDWNDAIETFFLDRSDESHRRSRWTRARGSAPRGCARLGADGGHHGSISDPDSAGALTTLASAIVSVRTIGVWSGAKK